MDLSKILAPKRSKHYDKGDNRVGATAGQIYIGTRKVSRSHGSSLRKLQRMMNIEAGLRPLRYNTEWQRGDQH